VTASAGSSGTGAGAVRNPAAGGVIAGAAGKIQPGGYIKCDHVLTRRLCGWRSLTMAMCSMLLVNIIPMLTDTGRNQVVRILCDCGS
jgi:hypothetical protein